MLRKAFGALLFAVISVAWGLAQQPSSYLDLYIAKVKPEKRAEFDAINKKMADANRRLHGDMWLAFEAAYGEQNVVVFSSSRSGYGDVEKSMDVFMGAMNKAFGEAGAKALFQEFSSTLESSRTEIRKRRPDLSYNPPADGAAYAQMIGNARWIRTSIVHVRPGHDLEFEALLKDINAAYQKTNQPGMRLVSQTTMGGNPSTYYVTRILTSMGEMDPSTSFQELLGGNGYQDFENVNARAVASVETVLFRILPEISNPSAEIVAVAPDYWNPKPKAAAAPKPKAAEPPKPAAKDKP